MSNDEIRELIQLVTESGIAELELQRGEDRVRIRRILQGRPEYGAIQAVAPAPAYGETERAPKPNVGQPASPSSTAAQPAAPPPSNEHIVKSPIVGTYYESPKPGDPVFVKVGDTVEAGQIVCIIESMKLMNEIESDIAGTVVAKLVENGKPVEYGEPLFAIRPR